MNITRADLAKLSPADLARVLDVVEAVEQDEASGRVPWLCDKAG